MTQSIEDTDTPTMTDLMVTPESLEAYFDVGRCPACQGIDQPGGTTHLLGCPNAAGTTPSTAIMDYPDAWAFVLETKVVDHHERCSWRTTKGALLCDCSVLGDEYERRRSERDS